MKKITLVVLSVLLLMATFSTHLLYAQESTQAAFQAFERGYMIWRGDTSGVWVLFNDAWQARYFPQSEYENLPDNPITSPEPVGLFKPVNGFGRVWGNFAEVREALGWAIAPEQGYTANFRPASYTAGGLAQTAVNIPNGRDIVIREDDTWQFDDSTPRAFSSLRSGTVFSATLQAFERGYMMWWSETGTVWVLRDTSNQVILYDSLSYGALPDNPVTEAPPDGMIKPIMGLGKVWGNFPEMREALGWATGPEQSYQVTFERLTPPEGYEMLFFGMVSHADFGSIVIWGSEWYIEGPELPSSTFTPQPPTCTPRADWPVYTVRAGDTLYRIAQRTGSTVDALVLASCLSDPNQLYVGQELRVPTLPPAPTVTSPPVAGTLTYVNGLGQYAFNYPADWYIRPVRADGAHITLTSYDPVTRNPSAGEFASEPNLVRIDFYVEASAHSTLEAWMDDHNVHRDTIYTHIVAEDWWTLPTGQRAARLRLEGTSIESGEHTSWSEFYTLINGNIIKGLGLGARFDEIVYSVQALVAPPAEAPPASGTTTYTSMSNSFTLSHDLPPAYCPRDTPVSSRSRCTSRTGGSPKRLLYSRLKWDASLYPTR